nr:ribonuclease H-like domain-containing protein [Tanacetum cinerariifolium]
NKLEIDTLSLDDLCNNLKIYEPEVKETSSSNSYTQNVAFVSSNNTNSTNGGVNTAHGVTTASTQATTVNSTLIDNLSDAVIYLFFAGQPNSPHFDNDDLQQIHPDDSEEMDLKWQMAMLTMRTRRFLKNTGRKFSMNGNETIRLGGYDWSDQAKEGPNFSLMAYSSTSSNSELSTDSNYSASYSKDEDELRPKIEKKIVKPSFAKIEFVKSKEQVKSPRKTTVKRVEKPTQHTHKPRDNQRN